MEFNNEKIKGEAGTLLEESWFFGNLLHRKPRMSRCYSDPCPSSNYSQEMIVRKSYDESPSSSQLKSSSSLRRAPSLPPCLGREEVEDEESEFTMGRLIRQASLNLSDMLPPRQTPKGMKQSCSTARQQPRRKPKQEKNNLDSNKEMRRAKTTKQKKNGMSQNDLESEEIQGFKDLGFQFDNTDLSLSVVNILPGLQEKSRVDSDEEEVSRPYLSESWQAQNSAPKIPNWVDQKSAKDVKAQIKFWARAVASNVRQEC